MNNQNLRAVQSDEDMLAASPDGFYPRAAKPPRKLRGRRLRREAGPQQLRRDNSSPSDKMLKGASDEFDFR
jgi:hypothetical protein